MKTFALIEIFFLIFLTIGSAENLPPQDGLILWLDATDTETTITSETGQVTQWLDKSPRQSYAKSETGPRLLGGKNRLVRFGGNGETTSMQLPVLHQDRIDTTTFIVARRTEEQAGEKRWQKVLISEVDSKERRFQFPYAVHEGDPGALPLAILTRVQRRVDPSPLLRGGEKYLPLEADLGEILVYVHDSTDTEAYESVVDYLAAKWGVEVLRGPDGWTRVGPIPEAVESATNEWPLIDQGNAADWRKFDPWSDEFDGVALDETKWWDHNPEWYGRPPAAYYAENVVVQEGELQMTIRKDPSIAEFSPYEGQEMPYEGYSAASVVSKSARTYGCFEVRARMSTSSATSSWWFAGQSQNAEGAIHKNELDVYELPAGSEGHEHNFGMNMHVFREGDDNTKWANWGNWKAPFRWDDEYHTITYVWSPHWIRYYVDGHIVRTTRNVAWHQPLRMIFDMEIMSWLPFPEDDEFPATYHVDFVRAWVRDDWIPADPTFAPLNDPAVPTKISEWVREQEKERDGSVEKE